MMLWNLDLNEACRRMWVEKEWFKKFLDENWYHKVDKCDDVVRHKKWYHIYDIPFTFMCWTKETAQAIYWYLSKFDIKEYVQFSREEVKD